MRTNFKRSDPSPVIVDAMTPASGTGNYRGYGVVRIPITASSSTTGTGWINPESGTVAAKAFVVFTTAGTGTVDVGVTSDGTGVAADMIDGGTMAVNIVVTRTTTGTDGAGTVGEAGGWLLVGPGGTGTKNSISLNHDEAATSTAVGHLVITYFPIEA